MRAQCVDLGPVEPHSTSILDRWRHLTEFGPRSCGHFSTIFACIHIFVSHSRVAFIEIINSFRWILLFIPFSLNELRGVFERILFSAIALVLTTKLLLYSG